MAQVSALRCPLNAESCLTDASRPGHLAWDRNDLAGLPTFTIPGAQKIWTLRQKTNNRIADSACAIPGL